MEVEKRGIPTVSIVTEAFTSLAKSAAKSYGYPDLPMVVVPHPFETLPREEVRRIADAKFEEIVRAACRPRRIAAKKV